MENNNLYIDKELFVRVAKGDEGAFRTLYHELYRPLLFFARSLIDDPAQSEDIVMVAFIKYWEIRDQFDDLVAVRSFLYTTVRHACYRHFTHLEVRERHSQFVRKEAVTGDDYIESRIILAEMIRQIRYEIERLNPKYREVVRLLFIEELPVKEVADRLSITEENVRKRKERAIGLLRNRIVRKNLGNIALFYLILQLRMP